MIPLLHDFSDATVLVFGGGPVGARKARRFAREARVVVISPTFAAADFGGAERVRAAPEPAAVAGWLERARPALVVAATDAEAVNDAVVAAARERAIMVNRADRARAYERDAGDVVVPATVRDDPVIVSVSTGATAPALSKYLRQELEDSLAGAGDVATVLGEVRARLADAGVPSDRRREIVTDIVNSPSVWTPLRSGGANTSQVIEDVSERIADLSADDEGGEPS